MALDRFIYWNERHPDEEELRNILVNFFNGAGVIQRKPEQQQHGHVNKPWWFISLPGTPCHPLKDVPELKDVDRNEMLNTERWIEVCAINLEDSIDIMTRAQDDFTNALAHGLATRIASWYQAVLDEGDGKVDYSQK